MPFKINISHKGKSTQLETESEVIVGKNIGETIKGEDISADLEGYELEITGTSDISGLPGFKGLEGAGYHRRLLTYGPGMHNRKKGIRLRKTNRGQEISLKISQVNTKLIKEGKTKFEDLANKPSEGEGEAHAKEKPIETPKPVKEKKEESKPEEKSAEEKPKEEPKTKEQ